MSLICGSCGATKDNGNICASCGYATIRCEISPPEHDTASSPSSSGNKNNVPANTIVQEFLDG